MSVLPTHLLDSEIVRLRSSLTALRKSLDDVVSEIEEQEIICKLKGFLQTCCVFFSSFSILLIAMDRYIIIVTPYSTQISIKMAFLLSLIILIISAAFSSPLFFLTKLEVQKSAG